MMTLSHRYLVGKTTGAKSRFDILSSTGDYAPFEEQLINKRNINVGGLSISLVKRPKRWKGDRESLALTKNSKNITSIKRPDIHINKGFGDIKNTEDACIIVFNEDYKEVGIQTIEIFIAKGHKSDVVPLWNLLIEGELDKEMEHLRNISQIKFSLN